MCEPRLHKHKHEHKHKHKEWNFFSIFLCLCLCLCLRLKFEVLFIQKYIAVKKNELRIYSHNGDSKIELNEILTI